VGTAVRECMWWRRLRLHGLAAAAVATSVAARSASGRVPRRGCGRRPLPPPPPRLAGGGTVASGRRRRCRRRNDGWRRAAGGEEGGGNGRATRVRVGPRVGGCAAVSDGRETPCVCGQSDASATRPRRDRKAVGGGRHGRRVPLWLADGRRRAGRWRATTLPPPSLSQRHEAAAAAAFSACGGEAKMAALGRAGGGGRTLPRHARPSLRRGSRRRRGGRAARSTAAARPRAPRGRRWPRSRSPLPVPTPCLQRVGRLMAVPCHGRHCHRRGHDGCTRWAARAAKGWGGRRPRRASWLRAAAAGASLWRLPQPGSPCRRGAGASPPPSVAMGATAAGGGKRRQAAASGGKWRRRVRRRWRRRAQCNGRVYRSLLPRHGGGQRVDPDPTMPPPPPPPRTLPSPCPSLGRRAVGGPLVKAPRRAAALPRQ